MLLPTLVFSAILAFASASEVPAFVNQGNAPTQHGFEDMLMRTNEIENSRQHFGGGTRRRRGGSLRSPDRQTFYRFLHDPKSPAPENYHCTGTGNDGFDFDTEGLPCPYSGLAWKWFGEDCGGWQPMRSFVVPSPAWTAPKAWLDNPSKSTWWTPAATWLHPRNMVIPTSWTRRGWKSYLWPATSFVPDGTGFDGWSYDVHGNSRPVSLPEGFLYFGLTAGWQPTPSFTIPSLRWVPSSSWSPSHAKWWSPSQPGWRLPDYFDAPAWWKLDVRPTGPRAHESDKHTF